MGPPETDVHSPLMLEVSRRHISRYEMDSLAIHHSLSQSGLFRYGYLGAELPQMENTSSSFSWNSLYGNQQSNWMWNDLWGSCQAAPDVRTQLISATGYRISFGSVPLHPEFTM